MGVSIGKACVVHVYVKLCSLVVCLSYDYCHHICLLLFLSYIICWLIIVVYSSYIIFLSQIFYKFSINILSYCNSQSAIIF